MGLFGLFKKKTDYFDKKIEPKCAYCEHGQPGRSNKMILCTKCGIVNEDYSCKKFTYSPLKRIPDRVHPIQDPSLMQDNSVQSEASEKPDTVKTVAVEKEKTENAATEKNESNPEENTTEIINTVKTNSEKETAPTVTEKQLEKTSAQSVSDIRFTPQGNEENIKKLEEIPQPQLSGIANSVAPKEINLPDVQDNAVSSIANSPIARNSEEYLKTVSEQEVSGFVNGGGTTHKLPENTKIQSLSDL